MKQTQLQRTMRAARAGRDLSLSEAARKLGITKAHLHAIEAGTSANPSLDLVRSVKREYGLCLCCEAT